MTDEKFFGIIHNYQKAEIPYTINTEGQDRRYFLAMRNLFLNAKKSVVIYTKTIDLYLFELLCNVAKANTEITIQIVIDKEPKSIETKNSLMNALDKVGTILNINVIASASNKIYETYFAIFDDKHIVYLNNMDNFRVEFNLNTTQKDTIVYYNNNFKHMFEKSLIYLRAGVLPEKKETGCWIIVPDNDQSVVQKIKYMPSYCSEEIKSDSVPNFSTKYDAECFATKLNETLSKMFETFIDQHKNINKRKKKTII